MGEKILGKERWGLIRKLRYLVFVLLGTVRGFGAKEEGDQKKPQDQRILSQQDRRIGCGEERGSGGPGPV